MNEIYKDYPTELKQKDVVLLEVGLSRLCKRDIFGARFGTYYPYAKSYWKNSMCADNGRYIAKAKHFEGAKGHIEKREKFNE